jgi:hypothetical protein
MRGRASLLNEYGKHRVFNSAKPDTNRRECVWEKPPLFLKGLHTIADKGSVQVAGTGM